VDEEPQNEAQEAEEQEPQSEGEEAMDQEQGQADEGSSSVLSTAVKGAAAGAAVGAAAGAAGQMIKSRSGQAEPEAEGSEGAEDEEQGSSS
jgi:hypothetical protein